MFQLPSLPYDYDALEPHIDAKTMEIHHTKHHQGYTDKLNKALEQAEKWQDKPIEEILQNLADMPADIRSTVQNNGGGYYNHSLFWTIMSPDAGEEPEGELADAINSAFGSFNEFKKQFSETASGVFGSGWAWLINNGGNLAITTTPNQNSPIMEKQNPILGLDVWEHAYYLKHQNKRADYIEAWWNVVNWEEVNKRYKTA